MKGQGNLVRSPDGFRTVLAVGIEVFVEEDISGRSGLLESRVDALAHGGGVGEVLGPEIIILHNYNEKSKIVNEQRGKNQGNLRTGNSAV